MASATLPGSPLSVMVPNPRRGIRSPLLSVTHGIEFFSASGAANDRTPPRPRNMAEAALVCRNWRRFIPLELGSLFILVVQLLAHCDYHPNAYMRKLFVIVKMTSAKLPMCFRFTNRVIFGFFSGYHAPGQGHREAAIGLLQRFLRGSQ